MNRFVNATKGKPCTCPDHRTCTSCYDKKLKPRIQVEQSRKPHIPIKVEHFTERKGKVIRIKESLNNFIKKPKPAKKETPTRTSTRDNIYRWYRRRRALREQKLQERKELRSQKKAQKEVLKEQKLEEEKELKSQKKAQNEILKQQKLQKQKERKSQKKAQKLQERKEHKEYLKEQKELKKAQLKLDLEEKRLQLQKLENAKIEEKNRLQREKEALEQLKEEERQLKSYYAAQLREEAYPYNEKRIKNKKFKKTAYPKREIVKTYNHHDSWKSRLSHWFYRFCCQFYCYLTCILAVFFVVIFVI